MVFKKEINTESQAHPDNTFQCFPFDVKLLLDPFQPLGSTLSNFIIYHIVIPSGLS